MNSVLQRIKTNSLITALIYALLGLSLLIWPGVSTDILCILLGVVLLGCGIIDGIIYLSNRDGSLYSTAHLLLGIVLAVIGIWIMRSPGLIISVIPRVIGILICIHGLADVSDAMTLRRSGYGRWSTALILGILTLALGAVLVYDPFDAVNTVMRVLGFFLLYDGVSDIWITTRVSQVLKQAEKDAKAQADAVDVDFKDVP